MMMPEKRILYLTGTGLTVYRWDINSLQEESAFSGGHESLRLFAAYLKNNSGNLFYLLVDILKEEFQQENIPFLRGSDRKAVITRKTLQLFRETSLSTTISLGREREGRRDERILFAALTSNEQFIPWLDILLQMQTKLVGIYSTALISAALLKKMNNTDERCLLITTQQSGLRQNYFEGGKIRFSRFVVINDWDPEKVAATCAEEVEKIHHYLESLRILPRDHALSTIIVAHQTERASFNAHCTNTDKLTFRIVDFRSVTSTIGLQRFPENTRGEVLFSYLLGQDRPLEQFAKPIHRRFYQLWQMRMSLFGIGAAILSGCMLFSAWRILEVYQLHHAIESARQQAVNDARRYAEMTKTFPTLPTSAETLKAMARRYTDLVQSSVDVRPLLIAISKSLDVLPQLELEQLEWAVNNTADTQTTDNLRTKTPAIRSRAGDTFYQTAIISGSVVKGHNEDYRTTLSSVSQFMDSLSKTTSGQVTPLKMPFDTALSKRLSTGEVEKVSDAPKFSVKIVKKPTSEN